MKRLKYVSYPKAFTSEYIKVHWAFEEDLRDLLDRSGLEETFWAKYHQRLRYLIENGNACHKKKDWFEILKETDGLYSMKIKGTKNIRILFSFMSNGRFALLLSPFEDTGRTSYRQHIPIAQSRLKGVMEDD